MLEFKKNIKLNMLLFGILSIFRVSGQYLPHPDSVETLLDHPSIQVQVTLGINDLYNFKFKKANSLFGWFRNQYPKHALPYFLFGMSKWWQIMSDEKNKTYRKSLFAYMDTAIYYAKKSYKNEPLVKAESSFFLSLSYGIKASVLGENGDWKRAVFNSKQALKYLDIAKEYKDLTPELLLGEAIYNYYSVWLPENYPILKPVFWFFRDGNQKKGLQLFEQAIQKSFYTRIEAVFLLLRIYLQDQKNYKKARELSQYLHKTFPDNAHFHYYYARSLYALGMMKELKKISLEIIKKVENKEIGYNNYANRYASFFLGYYYYAYNKKDSMQYYFRKTIRLSEDMKYYKSGYYLFSLEKLGQFAASQNKKNLALSYYKKIIKYSNKKKKIYKRTKESIQKLKKR